MFPKVNALPGAEDQEAPSHRDGQVHSCESGADMRRHVIIAFSGVNEHRIAVWNEAAEEGFEIAANIRVGIFLNEQ